MPTRTRKAIHKWTTHDRELLALLKTKFSRKFIALIFNHLLSSRLTKEGFQYGMTAPSLDAQWQEMKTGGGGHEVYARISNLSERDIKRSYQNILNEIEATIRTLRLKMQPSPRISKPSARARQNRSLNQRIRRPNRVQEPEISDASPEPEPLQTFVRSRLQQYVNRSPYFPSQEPTNTTTENSDLVVTIDAGDAIPPTPRINTDIHGHPAQARPLLLFRSTDTVSAFRSRRYVNESKPVRPPKKFGTQEYRDEAWPHLQRHKAYPSPFISFATKASDAIGRIETATSEDLETKRFLAIFSFNEVEADAARKFGAGSGPHPVAALFSKDEISDLPKGYKGAGEVSGICTSEHGV